MKMRVSVADKKRKTLEGKARFVIVPRSLSHTISRVMLESERTIATTGTFVVKKGAFPETEWTSVVGVNKDDMDEPTGDKGGD